MAGVAEFLIHVDFPTISGDIILERESSDWKVVYSGLANGQAWTQGKLGFWEWDTSRDVCLCFDDRAKRSPGVMANLGLAAGNSPFIAVGLMNFNPRAATFGFSGPAAWGSDYGQGMGGAPRGTWEIVAKPEDLAAVQGELVKLHAEIEAEYRSAAIDAFGIVDPTPISDLAGAAIAIRAQDYIGASLSLVSVLPYLGDAVGKTIKASRLAAKLTALYNRLKRVMRVLQMLEEKAARARKAAREALERAAAQRRRAEQMARDAERRIRKSFGRHIAKRYAGIAKRAGWNADDLARACEWCRFTNPPKFMIARKRGPDFARFQNSPLYIPKPLDVKLKSAKSGPNKGLVVKPSEADFADIVRREGEKSAKKMRENIKELEAKGWSFDSTGALLDPGKRKVYSDVDFMGIYNVPPGRGSSAWGGRLAENDDPFYADWLNDHIFGGRKNKQHGNQDRLGPWDDLAEDVNAKPFRMPDADELHTEDAFLVIGPDGVPHNVSWTELQQLYKQYGVPDPYSAHL